MNVLLRDAASSLSVLLTKLVARMERRAIRDDCVRGYRSNASKLASLASSFVPAYLLNSVSERCDEAFQSTPAEAVRHARSRSPTRLQISRRQ